MILACFECELNKGNEFVFYVTLGDVTYCQTFPETEWDIVYKKILHEPYNVLYVHVVRKDCKPTIIEKEDIK